MESQECRIFYLFTGFESGIYGGAFSKVSESFSKTVGVEIFDQIHSRFSIKFR